MKILIIEFLRIYNVYVNTITETSGLECNLICKKSIVIKFVKVA